MNPNMLQNQESAVATRKEWLSLQNFGWKRVLGQGYLDGLSHQYFFDIVRSLSYTYDPKLTAMFRDFTKTYDKFKRLKQKGRRGFWNFLWSVLVAGILLFAGLVCASLANFLVPASIGETVLSFLKISSDSLPGEDVLKIVGIALFAAGALLFLLYTVIRTLIVIPVKRAKAKERTIEIMLEAREYVLSKSKKSKASSIQITGKR